MTYNNDKKEAQTAKFGFVKEGLSYFNKSELQRQPFVLLMNFCTEKPCFHKANNNYALCW